MTTIMLLIMLTLRPATRPRWSLARGYRLVPSAWRTTQREGKRDERVGSLEDKADDATDAVHDKVDDAIEKVADIND